MRKVDVYMAIIRDAISKDVSPEDLLLHALVLHTHSIVLRDGVVLEDVRLDPHEQQMVLAPLTRNHVAELLATAFGGIGKRASPDFWFVEYARVAPYESFDEVPEDLRERAMAARRSIERHRVVERLVEE
jgi:hypothetical protein